MHVKCVRNPRSRLLPGKRYNGADQGWSPRPPKALLFGQDKKHPTQAGQDGPRGVFLFLPSRRE